ncbi:MAG: NADH-quinone oxidoreductase subunit N, partial [Pseudomonadota bacterium]
SMAATNTKYLAKKPANEAELYALAVIGVLASVVGAFYYLRVIKTIWFDEPADEFVPMSGELRVVLLMSGLFVTFYVVFAGYLSDATATAAASFF